MPRQVREPQPSVPEGPPGLWAKILDDARHYPSPHNSQPIKVRITGPHTADIFYDLDLGLPAENFGIPFAHVCAGVFLTGLEICASARSYTLAQHRINEEMDFTSSNRLHLLAHVELAAVASTDAGSPTPAARLKTFLTRQTNRRPYDSRVVDSEVLTRCIEIAKANGQALGVTADRTKVDRIIEINQRTLFSDLENDAVHQEILTWLRTSKRQTAMTGDGLSAETMLIPGWLIGFAMRHRAMWRWPVIGAAIRGAYLKTMRGVPQLAWLTGRFEGPLDYMASGETFLKVWLELTAAGVALHPFGTVITNPESHAALIREIAGPDGPGVNAAAAGEPPFTWMLFRIGYAKTPPQAHRRSLSTMIIEDEAE